jgi:thioesterase domain-containing protein
MNIFIRGLLGRVFSTGMDDLANVKKPSIVIGWSEWKRLAKDIKEMVPKERIIRIVGHSLGARAALKLGKDLLKSGYNVEVIVCLDYVEGFFSPKIIPTKRIKTYHFYTKDRRVEKLDNAVNKPYLHLSHTELDNDKDVQREILSLLGGKYE